MDIKTQEMVFMFLKKKAGMSLEEVEEMEDLQEMDAAEAVDALEVGDEGQSIDPGAGCVER